MKERGMKKKNTKMINTHERKQEVGNSEAKGKERENNLSGLERRLRE